jgi:hypothetical protein
MERVRQGVLRQLPLAEFDELVARATDAATVHRDPPRLVESRFRAVLDGEAFVGAAEWKIIHRQLTPGFLSVDPFNLAVRRAAWDDGSPALFGDLDPRPQTPGLELLIGRPGIQTLKIDWSARGVPEPGGLRFDLQVPACPVAVLELDLPADREPAASRDDGLLTGPLPGSSADRRLWRLAFAGASQLDVIVRTAAGQRPSPLVLVKQRSRLDVTPGQTLCEFAFDLEAPHAPVRDFVVRLEPGLQPTEVSVRNLERWEVQPEADPKLPIAVAVRLREPLHSGILTVRAVASAAATGQWICPGASVVGAVPRGESVTLRVHPDLHLDNWRAGSYRLTDSAVTPDRWQVLTLQAGLIRTSSGRPTATLRRAGPDYQVREQSRWHVAPDRMTLTAKLAVQVARGPVEAIPIRLPVGWSVERIEADPPDLLAAETPNAVDQLLRIALQRPLGPGKAAELTLHLARRTPTAVAGETTIPFPEVIPLEARGCDGTIAIHVSPALQATVTGLAVEPKSPNGNPPNPATDADRSDAPPTYLLPLRTANEAMLRLRSRPTRLRARTTTTVTVVGPRATIDCRMLLQPDAGGAEGVIVKVSGAGHALMNWQVIQGPNQWRSAQRMDVPALIAVGLAGESAWNALVNTAVAAESPDAFWQVTFARPLTESIELDGRATLVGPIAGRPWAVPLVRLPSVDAEDCQIILDLRSAPELRPRAVGLVDVPTVEGSPGLRTFRYSSGPAVLTVEADDSATAAGVVDRARLVTYAVEPGQLVHRLTFQLWNWTGRTIPVDLPSDAVVRQVRVNGFIARSYTTGMAGNEFHLEIPAPAGARRLAVELLYSTPGPANGRLLTHMSTTLPRLPTGDVGLQRIWCLPSDAVPLWSRSWQELPRDEDTVERPSQGTVFLPVEMTHATYWELTDPMAVGSAFWVARPRDFALLGGLAAVAGLALAWAARAWTAKLQWIALLTWLALSAVAFVWLPEPLAALARWPLVAAIIVACWRLLPQWTRLVQPAAGGSRAGVLTASILLIAWFMPLGRAAAPAPVVVYLVAGPDNAPASMTVLAPPDLLARLRDLGRRGPGGLDAAAWVESRYDGKVVGDQAEFTATLRLHAFTDNPPPLALPLTGVQLRDVKLDGAPAFPRATGDRYLVTVQGRGPHTLEVSFSAPLDPHGDATGEADRELRFGIPDVVSSHLTLAVPSGATQVQALSWRGAQQIEADAGHPRLDVDLGRVNAVYVRWRPEGQRRPAMVRTKETYLWDLTEAAARLLGAVRFTIGPSTVTTLSIDIPKDLEVVTISAHPLDASVAATTGWLRAWRVGPPGIVRRPLILDFAVPITGAWQVNLTLAPREPFAATFTLPFPFTNGVQQVPPVFGWRGQSLSLADVQPVVAVPMAPEAFLKDYWQPAKVETADPQRGTLALPTAAYQRAGNGPAPTLRLRATVGPRQRATSACVWRIGPQRADLEASAHVTATDGRVSLVEWDVPAVVTVADVHGPDLLSWSRTGSRLQAWLIHPVAETTVQVVGSVSRPTETARFDVPLIRPRAAETSGTLRVAAVDGLTLTPVVANNLVEKAQLAPGGREMEYTFGPQPFKAAFQVRFADGVTDYRLRTEAALRDRVVTATTTIEARVRRGELRSFVVSTRAAGGWGFRFDAPGGARVREAATGPDMLSWKIDLPPGVTTKYQMTLTAQRPLDTLDVALPDVNVAVDESRQSQVQRVVAISGAGLRPVEVTGLRAMPGSNEWQVATADWRLRLNSSPASATDGTTARGELADLETARGDDGRWIHRGTFWLTQSAAAVWRATWPASVQLLAIEVDGGSLPSPADLSDAIKFTIPAGSSVHCVRLVWTRAGDGPPTAADVPNLAANDLSVPMPVLWTVLTPSSPHPDTAPLPVAAAALYRAAAQVRLADASRGMGPSAADAGRAARIRAATELRRAEAALTDAADMTAGPNGITLAAWRQQLADVLRAAGPTSGPPPDAGPLPYDDAFARGTPSTWYTPAADDGPRLTWLPTKSEWFARAMRTAAFALIGCVGICIGRWIGGSAWPELLAVLGVAAVTAGVGLLGLVPAVGGVVARGILLGQTALQRWWPDSTSEVVSNASAGAGA